MMMVLIYGLLFAIRRPFRGNCQADKLIRWDKSNARLKTTSRRPLRITMSIGGGEGRKGEHWLMGLSPPQRLGVSRGHCDLALTRKLVWSDSLSMCQPVDRSINLYRCD